MQEQQSGDMHHLGSLIKRIDGVLKSDNLNEETFVDLYMQFALYLKRIKNLTGISPDFVLYRIELIQPQTEGEFKQVLSTARNALATLQESYEHELAVAQAGAANNVATASAHATASAQVTISQTFEALESCQLTDDELSKLKAAVKDLEAAREKGPTTVCEKAAALLDLAKKGIDIVTAVAPFAASILGTLRPGA